MKLSVHSLDGKKTGEVEVADSVFAAPFRKDLLARVVLWQLAKRRAGTHKAKNRTEIRGSTRKIMRQKGSGSSRRRTRKVSHFRGGGAVFGPVPRSHAHSLQKKVRQAALCSALSEKQREGKLFVLEQETLETPKTSLLAEKRKNWDALHNAMIVLNEQPDRNFRLAARNLPRLLLIAQQGLNVYDIVKYDALLLGKSTLAEVVRRGTGGKTNSETEVETGKETTKETTASREVSS